MSIAKNGYRRKQFGKSLVMICQKHNETMIKPADKGRFQQIAPRAGEMMEQLRLDNSDTEISINVSDQIAQLVSDAIRVRAFINPMNSAWAEIELK